MTVTERARTVAKACISGTLGTACSNQEAAPFGSHVDFILDEKGWPVMLLNEYAMHTKNVEVDPRASLFAQMPSKAGEGQPVAAMERVTIMGEVVPVTDQDELFTLRATYSVTHQFATSLVESDKFKFVKLKPSRIFYSAGFGVNAQWIDMATYEDAVADPLALEQLALVNKINRESSSDLLALCTQFIPGLESGLYGVKCTGVDRLGMDLRVEAGDRTEIYRVGFQVAALSLEDAKSEVTKIFQEAWEKENGNEWEDMGPPVLKTGRDILHSD